MEKIDRYRMAAKKIITDLGVRKNKASKGIRYQAIADDDTGNYLLLRNGWKGANRFYSIIIHIEVMENGRVWLHQDNTDLIIADTLLAADVAQSDIVLGFQAPIVREDTEFAVG
jgi:hypothetical protein